jgi:hypothetical protein
LALLLFLRRRLGSIEGRLTAVSLARVLLACLGMGGAMLVVLAWGERADIPSLVLVVLAGGTGGAVYLLVGRLVGIRVLGQFASALIRRT